MIARQPVRLETDVEPISHHSHTINVHDGPVRSIVYRKESRPAPSWCSISAKPALNHTVTVNLEDNYVISLV